MVLKGVFEVDCKVPCHQVKAIIKEIAAFETKTSDNDFFIVINQEMQRTTVTVDKFDIMESLNFLGSNLGLLPGLGLFQLLESFVLILLGYKSFKALKFFTENVLSCHSKN